MLIVVQGDFAGWSRAMAEHALTIHSRPKTHHDYVHGRRST
jgi:hypothetical protein